MKIAGLLLALLGLSAPSALAADLFVNSTRDRVDIAPGDRVCSTGFLNADGSPECTLRAAVQESQWPVGGRAAYWIHLPPGEFQLDLVVPVGENEEDNQLVGLWNVSRAVQYGDLDISLSVRITGAGQGVTTIDAANHDRVFDIWAGFRIDVTIEELTIAHGFTNRSAGGCINNRTFHGTLWLGFVTLDNCTAYLAVGGALFNEGAAFIGSARFQDNNAPRGGAIHNSAIAQITNTTFAGNGADTSFEFGQGRGGAISNFVTFGDEPSLIVTNSTFSGNIAPWGSAIVNGGHASVRNSTISGNIGQRGALANVGAGRLGVSSSTIASNVGPGVFREFASLQTSVGGSILSNNRDQLGALLNCSGGLSWSGTSIEDANTCGLAGDGDIINTDPMIGPLANNGGPTLTHLPAVGSPVIDAAGNRYDPTDQRGLPPEIGAGADMGSVERGFELTLLIPIDWTLIFLEPVTMSDTSFRLSLSLLTPGKTSFSMLDARIIGAKAANGQATFDVSKDGRSMIVSGVFAPPKDQANSTLFYLEVLPGAEKASQLKISNVACACDAKPRKNPPTIVISSAEKFAKQP